MVGDHFAARGVENAVDTGLSHTVRVSIARPDGVPVLLYAARASRDTASHHLRSRDRYPVRLRRALALWLAACAACDGDRRIDGADGRRRVVAPRDRRADDPAQCRPSAGRRDRLIISLGIVTRPFHLLVIEIAGGDPHVACDRDQPAGGHRLSLWTLRDDAPRP